MPPLLDTNVLLDILTDDPKWGGWSQRQFARAHQAANRPQQQQCQRRGCGHQHQNAIRRTYNRATYWPERVALMQKWADMLDAFRRSS